MKNSVDNQTFPFSPERMNDPKCAINAKWKMLRNELKNGQYLSKDIDTAKKSKFLSEFHRLFTDENGESFFRKRLNSVFQESHCVRGAIIKGDEPEPTYDRFIPYAKYINEDNRFSPKGVEWLYLALGLPQNDDGLSKAQMCSQKECRAKNGDVFALCQFNYNHTDAEVIDLTIGDDWTPKKQQEIIRTIVADYYGKIDLNENREIIERDPRYLQSIVVIYANILSSELLVPLSESDDKSIMYAPFHCIAYYFKSLGYEGIIYKSTVYPEGKNMVLFDKNLAAPFGTIKKSILNG